MSKLVSFLHVSLDGFAATPNGEMDWIAVDVAMFDLSKKVADKSGTAIYGRVTFELMDSYWPTAADEPDASDHDRHHSAWYKDVSKFVVSKSMNGASVPNAQVISEDLLGAVAELKKKSASDIVLFGSPTVTAELSQAGLVDEYWLFINPIILGQGIPAFHAGGVKINLTLKESISFKKGIMGLHYEK